MIHDKFMDTSGLEFISREDNYLATNTHYVLNTCDSKMRHNVSVRLNPVLESGNRKQRVIDFECGCSMLAEIIIKDNK